MTDLLGSLLILAMLAIMAARTAPPLPAKVSGTPMLDVPLRPIFKLLAQRTNIIAILAVLILGSGFVGQRWIPHGLFLFAIVAMAGLLCFPARYRFTSEGVSPNRATFRPWAEFTGWVASGNVIYLKGASRPGSLKLYVAGKDRDAALKVVKRHLKPAR
ncbi:MAG: hypothetical protein KGJ86_04640 [Chloroflexota bacterium]|nr:hypothetical protein [Chloroflexota bacterium]